MQRWCKKCATERRRQWGAETGYNERAAAENAQSKRFRIYRQSRSGLISHLTVRRGYPRDEAEDLADVLLDPATACEICGVTNAMLRALYAKNFAFPYGTQDENRRLTPDNLFPREPHRLATTRILCRCCNVRRGADRYTDQEVLDWARREWRRRLPSQYLKWLK